MSGEALPYAVHRNPPANDGAALLCWTGLGLIFLGGCFMIGILAMMTPGFSGQAPTWRLHHTIFAAALYATALGCFSAAAWTIFLGCRRALRRGRD